MFQKWTRKFQGRNSEELDEKGKRKEEETKSNWNQKIEEILRIIGAIRKELEGKSSAESTIPISNDTTPVYASHYVNQFLIEFAFFPHRFSMPYVEGHF